MWNVAILALIPTVALAAPSGSPPKPSKAPDEAPPGLRMTISATTERIPLPRTRGMVQLSMDALAHRIRLIPAKGDSLAALLTRVTQHAGFLCPKVVLKDGAVELSCRNARIEAQLTRQGKEWYLDINELRGLPWRPGADAAPSFHYDPWKVGLGQSCPGKSPAARGECELKDEHLLEAAMQFRAALTTTGRQLASLRLGDVAIATGDPITAAGWYRRAGSFGSFGRVAASRLCELDGKCLQTTDQVLRMFDANGLPEPLRAETVIRGARAEAYSGRLPSAAHIIARQVRAHGAVSVCREGGELLCRRILLQAMQAAQSALNPLWPMMDQAARAAAARKRPALEKPERDYLEELLETYLALPSWEKGPLAVEMAQAAAPLAARLGAPVFGGNLLASLAPQVPDAGLSDHLLLAAETFMEGNNWARARIVAEYAQSRLAGKIGPSGKGKRKPGLTSLQNARWDAVFRTLALRAAQDEVTPAERAAIEAEFAATLEELKRARVVRDKVESVLRSAREARAGQPGGTPAASNPPKTPDAAAPGAPGAPQAATTSPKPTAPGHAAPTASPPATLAKNAEGGR